jgi:DNA-directed RNA polymerase subunit beta
MPTPSWTYSRTIPKPRRPSSSLSPRTTPRPSEDAYVEIYKRLRDGDLATADNARSFITGILNRDRYDISPVGRFRFNKRFGKGMDEKSLERRTLDLDDVATAIASIIVTLNTTPDMQADDIDHLGSPPRALCRRAPRTEDPPGS